MSVLLGQVAPDFEAETTEGRVRFHDWIGDSWAVLFSHPKDFTPVCTTELGYMAKIKSEFERRNVKVIGLSVDKAEDHRAQLRRGTTRDRLSAAHRDAQDRDTGELAAGRGRNHRRLRLGRGSLAEASRGVDGTAALYPHRSAAQVTPGAKRSAPSLINAKPSASRRNLCRPGETGHPGFLPEEFAQEGG